ncbi:MAG: hypothetical protein U0794_03575 [Isosphaeraceae bacterium]
MILTSNGERDLPPAFLRRCLRLDIPQAKRDHVERVVASNLENLDPERRDELIEAYITRNGTSVVANDQLLNALYLLASSESKISDKEQGRVLDEHSPARWNAR